MISEADERTLHRHRGFEQHLTGKFGKNRWLIAWNIEGEWKGGCWERCQVLETTPRGHQHLPFSCLQCQVRGSALYPVHFLECLLPVRLLVTIKITAIYGAYCARG